MNTRDNSLIEKILRYCLEIERTHQYFKDDKALFLDMENGAIYRNAVSMPILQIGELAKNLSQEYRSGSTEIPWKAIIRTRDFFAHHYGAVRYEELWETSHDNIMELKSCLQSAKKEHD